MVQYTIIRSKRKTAALHVKNGEAIIRAPYGYPKENIEQFVVQKEKWLTGVLAKQNSQIENKKEFVVNYNSTIMLRGKSCTIMENYAEDQFFNGREFWIPTGLTPEEIKARCVRLYKQILEVVLNERVAFYANFMGVRPTAVKISNAKTRWGSCSSRKRLNFSWWLMMAEDSVIDYVIIHELAHTIVPNHSSDFWRAVEIAMPHYKAERAKLKTLQQRLMHENW